MPYASLSQGESILLPSLHNPIKVLTEGGDSCFLPMPVEPSLWRAVFNTLEMGVVVCDCNRTITAVNSAAQCLLLPQGAQTWSQIPMAANFYLPGSRTPLSPEEFPLWQVLAGETFSDLELAIVHPTGERYRVLLSGYSLVEQEGNRLGAMINLYDITHRYRSEMALRFDNRELKTAFQQRLEDLQSMNQKLQQESAQLRQTEQALQESEHLFSTIANASPALVWMSGTDGQCIYFNRPWLDFRGRRLDEELGEGWVEGVHPQDADHCLSTYMAAFAARQPFSMEYRLRRHDGEYRWMVDQGQPRYATDGQFLGYVGTCLDISDRKHDEATLRLFFDLPFIGMAITSPATKQWVQVNDRLCEILGYSRQELQRMDWTEITHPDDLEKNIEEFDRVIAGEIQGYAMEKRFIRKDGEIVYATIDVKCVHNENGQVDFFMATIQDVTERTLAMEALARSEERFRATFEQAAVGIAHIDPDGTWLRVNQTLCDLVGYSRDELLTLTFQDITHPDDLAADLGCVNALLAGQRKSYFLEKRCVHKDRSIIWVNLTVALVQDDEQCPKYLIAVIQDITAAKRAAVTLQQYARRLQGLHQMDRAILTEFRPRDIARSALSLLCQLLECDQGIVTLLDEDTQSGFVIADNSGENLLFPAGTRLPLGDFVFSHASLPGPQIQRVDNLADLTPTPLIFQCFLATKICSAMAIPLVVDGHTIGEVNLADSRVGHFQPDHDEIAQEIANHLAIALQTASLLERIQHHRQRLQSLSNRMLETQESEHRLLAHELHDEIGQALTAVKLNLHRLERLSENPTSHKVLTDCLHVTETALQQVRNLSLDLRPSMLDDLGLLPALRWYIQRHQERTGLFETLVCEAALPVLSTTLETACFRIVQEALTNVARHAQATTVTVTLAVAADSLELTIQDDGIGFDLRKINLAKQQGSSLGLLGMQERGTLVGGQLTFTSAPHQGTVIHLKVPLAAPVEEDLPQVLLGGNTP